MLDEQNPGHPAMNVEWIVQKCGSGDQEHHEMVIGADIFTLEKNMRDGFVLAWFQFEDLDSDYYSSMTCTVEYISEDDNFASTQQVFVDAYHMKESDAWKANDSYLGTWDSWNENEKESNPLWVTMADGQQTNENW